MSTFSVRPASAARLRARSACSAERVTPTTVRRTVRRHAGQSCPSRSPRPAPAFRVSGPASGTPGPALPPVPRPGRRQSRLPDSADPCRLLPHRARVDHGRAQHEGVKVVADVVMVGDCRSVAPPRMQPALPADHFASSGGGAGLGPSAPSRTAVLEQCPHFPGGRAAGTGRVRRTSRPSSAREGREDVARAHRCRPPRRPGSGPAGPGTTGSGAAPGGTGTPGRVHPPARPLTVPGPQPQRHLFGVQHN